VSPGWKTGLLFLLKLLLTAGCLYWAFSEVDFSSTILSRPGELDFRWIAAGLVPAGLVVALTALRWQVFLAAQDIHVSFWRALQLTLIGNFFTLASIGSIGGDAARILLLNKHVPQRKVAITASVMVDHMSGMVAMALMFFLLTAGRFDALEEQSLLGKGALHFTWVFMLGGVLALAAGVLIMSPAVHGRVHKDGRWVKWEFIRTFPEACDRYRKKWRHALAGVGISCLMLLGYYLSFWAGARAVGCEVGAGTMFTVMPVVDAISAVPVTVSGIGIREKLFEVLLADFAGIPAAVAVSVSLTGFLLNVAWSLIGVVLFLRHRGELTMREIRESHA
jgi:uncharacterized protein (TIRG00374 family)